MVTCRGEELIEEVAASARALFVLSLGFELRSARVAEILKRINPDRARIRIYCIENDDANVPPLAIEQRTELRQKLDSSVGPEFIRAGDITERVRAWVAAEHPNSSVVIDASAMPRGLLFELLRTLSEIRNTFEQIHLLYTHPDDYVDGVLEEASPFVEALYASPTVRGSTIGALSVFPSFNANETAVVISHVLGGRNVPRALKVELCFAHPGARYRFYERAREAHNALCEYSTGLTLGVRLYRMDDVDDIAGLLISFVRGLGEREALFAAVLGPRVLCAPVFLTVQALRQRREANILVTRPLIYRSVRSVGVGTVTDGWRLGVAFRRIQELVVRAEPTP